MLLSGNRGWHYTSPTDRRVRIDGFGARSVKTGDGFIITDESSTAAHEYAHRIQSAIPELDAVFQKIHKARTKNDPLEKLHNLFPRSNYHRTEVTRKDGYYDAYQGREYDRQGAAEVMTMAIEPILGDFAKSRPSQVNLFFKFLSIDQDLFDTTLGLLMHYKPSQR